MNNSPIFPVLLCIGLAACHGNAQQVNGSLDGVEADMVFLYSTIGSDYVLIDSAEVGGNGSFSIPTDSLVTGFYQIGINDSDVVDIIVNSSEPEVRLSFSGTPLQENILIAESDENQLLWEYKLTSREAQAKSAALRQKKYELANTDSLARALIDMKIADNEEWKYKRLQELARKMPNSYFSKVTGLARDLDRAENLGSDAVLQVMDFADPELLRSSVYVKGILSYLRALPLKSEEQFLSGLDKLIEESAKNTECRNFTIEYFIDLFGQYGPELAFQHVVSKHVSDEDMVGLSEELRTRMRRIQKLRLGERAPDVSLPDMKGDSVRISDFTSRNEATLLFFYSSTCDHCHDQMPGLKVLYEGLHEQGFEILGIALDTDTIEFEYGIQKFELPWPSFTEFLGWGSPAAQQYEVAAAPTMILLDSDMRIMAKPLNARSLKDMLKQIPVFQNLNSQTE